MSVAEVASLFARCPMRWWLSGGWAIDHWLGSRTRDHGDIDVSTLRPHLAGLLSALPAGLRPFAAVHGHLLPLEEHLDDRGIHNIWVQERRRDRFVLQINVEEGDERVWRYRRDPRIELTWDRAVGHLRGVEASTPATQLLWKSRDPRTRDEHDLSVIHGALNARDRRWLRESIQLAHPGSPWADDARLADR